MALVEEGDTIRIDLPNRVMDLMVDEVILADRKSNWKAPEPRYSTGVLGKYARLVGSAEQGAVTN